MNDTIQTISDQPLSGADEDSAGEAWQWPTFETFTVWVVMLMSIMVPVALLPEHEAVLVMASCMAGTMLYAYWLDERNYRNELAWARYDADVIAGRRDDLLS